MKLRLFCWSPLQAIVSSPYCFTNDDGNLYGGREHVGEKDLVHKTEVMCYLLDGLMVQSSSRQAISNPFCQNYLSNILLWFTIMI